MPTTPHIEKHFTASETVRDVVIGMSDGLTVPFALAAGLSAAVTQTGIVVTAGLAEVAAGAIAMGLGGYLAARTDRDHYFAEVAREKYEIAHLRARELDEVRKVFGEFGLEGAVLESAVIAISADEERWTKFMMRFELGLDEPDPKRALTSALTIGGAYAVGGLVPLVPYMVIRQMAPALHASVVTTGIALLAFGAIKGHFTGQNKLVGAFQTLLVGGLAAIAAFSLARLFG